MQRFGYISVCVCIMCLTLCGVCVYGQDPFAPQPRTAEEIAAKQTEALVRDLDIRDKQQRDTIYAIHLKYARQRVPSETREQAVDRMNRLLAELKGVLSDEQYARLIARPRQQGPRRSQVPPTHQ